MASSNPLAAASAALRKADKFTQSVEGKSPSQFKKEAPKNEASVDKKTAAPKPSNDEGIGEGLAWNVRQAEAAKSSLPKYHDGGKVAGKGEKVIKAEGGETVLPKDDAKKSTELAMEHLHGMKAGLEHAKKHAAHKHAPKHGKVHHVGVKKVDDGSFIMTNQHHPMEDGSAVADSVHTSPDMDGVMNHMQEHMGEPNPGEAEAMAPPAGGAPAA